MTKPAEHVSLLHRPLPRWVTVSSFTGVFLCVIVTFFFYFGGTSATFFSWFKIRDWRYKRVLPVNLLRYYNNDGIAHQKNRQDGNFDHPEHPDYLPGSSFPADSLPEPGVVFDFQAAGGLKFLFPSSKDGALNNVACAGQTIEVPPGSYSELAFIAAAAQQSVEDTLGLYYRGRGEPSIFSVPGWLEKPSQNAADACVSPSHFKYEAKSKSVVDSGGPARLWLVKIPLNHEREFEGFSFPYNEDIHVFSISLRVFEPTRRLRDYSDRTKRAYAKLKKHKPVDWRKLARQTHRLGQMFESLKNGLASTYPRETNWLTTSIDYENYRLKEFIEDSRYLEEKQYLRSLKRIGDDIKALAAGRNPYHQKRGNSLRSYLSEIDGSLQPYSLSVPANYDSSRSYPLIILLHGHGWYRPFQGHPTLTGDNVFFAAPHGRGSMDYMFVAEDDLLKVIAEIKESYPIDDDRIVLTGSSMGGTGSWSFGTKFPHLFSAIGPKAGNADRRVWQRLWGWGRVFPGPLESLPEPFDTLCRSVADSLDPVSYADNLINLPAFCLHGAEDRIVPVGHARVMVKRLRALNYTVTYREDPEAGHGAYKSEFYDEQWNWLFDQKRNASPKKLRHRAWSLKHGRSYWLTISQFLEPARFGEIEAIIKDGKISIKTRNVRSLSIDWGLVPLKQHKPAGVGLSIDGEQVAHKGDSVFERAGNNWRPGEITGKMVKRPHLEGPVHDVYTTPFMLVYGTPDHDPDAALVLRREAQRFVDDWEKLYNVPCRIKPDSKISPSDIEKYSLVLYGNSEQNDVYRKLADRLPISINSSEVKIGEDKWEGPHAGAKFCFPNPLNPKRYVCVFAGVSWRGSYGINNRFGNWFHWGPFDNYNWYDYLVFDKQTHSPATVVTAGFFDPDWRLSEKYRFAGDKSLRSRSHSRKVPKYLSAPEIDRLYLSDLMPIKIEQHKGNPNSNLSFRSNTIRLGATRFRKGIGLRAPSRIEFQLGGRFDVLNTAIGIDMEGGKGTEGRTRNEYIQFQVWGDQRRLFRSPWMQWDSEPLRASVPITGVKRLTLKVKGSSARWHFGSAAWGDLYVEKEPKVEKQPREPGTSI